MRTKTKEMIWGDLLAGAGGVTTGALAVKGILVAWALNHSKEAIFTHQVNHPNTEHFHASKQLIKVDNEYKTGHIYPDSIYIYIKGRLRKAKNNQPCKAEVIGDKITIVELN